MTIWQQFYTFFWILFSVCALLTAWIIILSPVLIAYGVYRLWRWWKR